MVRVTLAGLTAKVAAKVEGLSQQLTQATRNHLGGGPPTGVSAATPEGSTFNLKIAPSYPPRFHAQGDH